MLTVASLTALGEHPSPWGHAEAKASATFGQVQPSPGLLHILNDTIYVQNLVRKLDVSPVKTNIYANFQNPWSSEMEANCCDFHSLQNFCITLSLSARIRQKYASFFTEVEKNVIWSVCQCWLPVHLLFPQVCPLTKDVFIYMCKHSSNEYCVLPLKFTCINEKKHLQYLWTAELNQNAVLPWEWI